MVIIQDINIFFITCMLIDCIPFAMPTPTIPPISVWVVETGNPIEDDNITVIVAPSVTEKPLDGFKFVMLLPIVDITLLP